MQGSNVSVALNGSFLLQKTRHLVFIPNALPGHNCLSRGQTWGYLSMLKVKDEFISLKEVSPKVDIERRIISVIV